MPSAKFLALAVFFVASAIGTALVIYATQRSYDPVLAQSAQASANAFIGTDGITTTVTVIPTATATATATSNPSRQSGNDDDHGPAPAPIARTTLISAAGRRPVVAPVIVPAPASPSAAVVLGGGGGIAPPASPSSSSGPIATADPGSSNNNNNGAAADDTQASSSLFRQPLPTIDAGNNGAVVVSRRPIALPSPVVSSSASSMAAPVVTRPAGSVPSSSTTNVSATASVPVPSTPAATPSLPDIDSDAAIIVDANRGRPSSSTLLTTVPAITRPATSSTSASATASSPRPSASPRACAFNFECADLASCCSLPSRTCVLPAAFSVANGGRTCSPVAPRLAPAAFAAPVFPANCARPPQCGPALPAALIADLTRNDAALANLTVPIAASNNSTSAAANATTTATALSAGCGARRGQCDTRVLGVSCASCSTGCGTCPQAVPLAQHCVRRGDVALLLHSVASPYLPTLLRDLAGTPVTLFVPGGALIPGVPSGARIPGMVAAARAAPGASVAFGSMGLAGTSPAAFRNASDLRSDLVAAELLIAKLAAAAGSPAQRTGQQAFPRVFLSTPVPSTAAAAAAIPGAQLALLATHGYTVVQPNVAVLDTSDAVPKAIVAQVAAAMDRDGSAIVAVRDGAPIAMSTLADVVRGVQSKGGRVVDLATCLGKPIGGAKSSQLF
ncbi:hypothetical protein BC828DRAFT_388353 [Blastocladiella britannica]|nr:hypothetical protein BC828DRAFT_388353 [Blastocladiella britannica]